MGKKYFAIFFLFFSILGLGAQGVRCPSVFDKVSATGDAEKDLALGKGVFLAAAEILEKGTGRKLPNDGRRAAIPRPLMEPLIKEFMSDYEGSTVEANRAGKTAAPIPIASGNKGHMQDHLDFYEKYKGDYQKYLGVDPLSLKLAIVAHDIGKGFMNELLDVYVNQKTKGDFLQRYVMAHEFHSIARIPEVVERALRSQGIDPTSESGRKLLFGASLQIMEMIRYHNGAHVVEKMKERYPDLNPAEIEGVVKAWWPENYRKFAEKFSDVGLKADYGTEVQGAIPAILNFQDRATLTSPSGPAKLAKQSYGQAGFTLDLIQSGLIDSAKGNRPLVKAANSDLRPYLLDKSLDINDMPWSQEAIAFNNNVEGLGKKILTSNIQAVQQLPLEQWEKPYFIKPGFSLVVPNAEGKVLPLTDTTPQYLYFKQGNGTWYRVNGAPPPQGKPAEATLEVWKPTEREWVPVANGQHPVDHLLAVAQGRE